MHYLSRVVNDRHLDKPVSRLQLPPRLFRNPRHLRCPGNPDLLSSIISKANSTSLLVRSNSSSTTAVNIGAAPVTCAIAGTIFGYLAASITAESTLALIDTA